MADPLSLLQEFAMGRRELRELQYNGKLYYVFGDVAYQHDARTNLGVYNKQDEYYTIESILLFWRMRELQHTAYVRDVSGRGITSITRVQRRDLLDFLNGGPLPKEANMLAPVPPPIPTAQLKPDKDQQAELDQQQTSSHYEPERKKPKLEQPDKKGQRIDKILDKSIGDNANAPATEVRGLSSSLPAEKVAQLRSRVKNNLKNKPLDDESFVSIAEMAPVPNASSDSIGRFIAEKERIRKDRTTCLESHSRDFSTIMAMVKDVHLRENQPKSIAQNQTGAMAGGMTSSMPGSVSQAQQQMKGGQKSMMPVPGGYSRYDQEIFQKEAVADFEIETDLTFHGNNALNQQQMNRAAASTRSTAPFTPNGVHARTPDPRQSSLAPVAAPGGGQRQQKRVSRTPIIIIPATGTALITMYNAQDILQDLRFVSSDEKKRTYRRENELLLQIPKNGSTVPYRIVDNPTKLKDEEWDRVVAVFVQGPAWQFKGWKWNGNPVEVFANVAAFHLKFEEQKLDSNVAKWSVNVLSLSRTKRHLDRAILQKFWEILDRHIAKSGKREWLRY